MTFEEFSASVGAAVPNLKPDALSIWRQFAVERVESEQFVHFEMGFLPSRTALERRQRRRLSI